MSEEKVEVEVRKEGVLEKHGKRAMNWLKNNWQGVLLGTLIYGLFEGTNTINLWKGDPFRDLMNGDDGKAFFEKPVFDFWGADGKFNLIPEFNQWWASDPEYNLNEGIQAPQIRNSEKYWDEK